MEVEVVALEVQVLVQMDYLVQAEVVAVFLQQEVLYIPVEQIHLMH
jgi:hypothetical protein